MRGFTNQFLDYYQELLDLLNAAEPYHNDVAGILCPLFPCFCDHTVVVSSVSNNACKKPEGC